MFNGVRFRIEKTNLKIPCGRATSRGKFRVRARNYQKYGTVLSARPLHSSAGFSPFLCRPNLCRPCRPNPCRPNLCRPWRPKLCRPNLCRPTRTCADRTCADRAGRTRADRTCADRTCAGRAGRTRADRADRNCAGRCQAALEALKRGDTSWPDQLGQQQCPLWVKSGRDALKFRCPLYPRNRTFPRAVSMSALGHKQTHALQKCAATRKQKDRLAAVGLLKIRLAPIDPGQIRPSRR